MSKMSSNASTAMPLGVKIPDVVIQRGYCLTGFYQVNRGVYDSWLKFGFLQPLGEKTDSSNLR